MIERTYDYREIKKVAPWDVVISVKIIYLIDRGSGLWVFHKHKDGMICHVEMDKNCRGSEAVEKCKEALQWVFNEFKKINTVYAEIPKENKPACHNVVRVGFYFTHEEENIRHYEVKR